MVGAVVSADDGGNPGHGSHGIFVESCVERRAARSNRKVIR
jgi:hypothetical protein